jgi:ABC-type multidrug transport system ATPase subunit
MNNAIEIDSVTKTYSNFRLRDIDLALPEHSILGLIGQNGAGKTTLFLSILNLIRRDSGSVRLPGFAEDISCEKIRRFIGYVPEKPVFYEWMTVAAALRFTSRFFAGWDRRRCERLTDRWALDPRKPIRHLSLGMKRKLSLIQALAIKPRLLILDEPTSGLDPLVKFQLLHELKRLVEEGETHAIMISSHNLDEVERLVDSIAVLKCGDLQVHEPKDRFFRAWRKIEFVPPAFAGKRPALMEKAHFVGGGRAMIVTREETGPMMRRLEQLGASALEIDRPSLQEIFLEVS